MTDKTVALITGANRGLGLEIARQLGRQGMLVVLGARDKRKGEEAVQALRQHDIAAHAVKLDVADQHDVNRLPIYFGEKFGRLDVLVNNAGISLGQADDIEAFRRTIDTNLVGAVAVTYALLPLLEASPAGRIVNHSSVLGSLTTIQKNPKAFRNFLAPAYTASKAGLNGFTVALAYKVRDTRIKVNAAHPGWVQTDMGGKNATLGVADGAKTAVRLATLPNDGPSGAFFHMDDTLPW
jgi:NAD(P)-dependent dehydrogenase (short-subunit alcohol dehydrogenase family)